MGRRKFATVLAFCMVLAAPALAEVAPVQNAVDGYIRPAFDALEKQMAQTRAAMDQLCAAPAAPALEAARGAFADTARAWGKVELIQLGPLTEQHRAERFLYWPDRKGIGLKQVQAALAGDDASFEDPAQLKGKSVAVQGLGALEFVLFGADAETLTGAQGRHRCAFGAAIARNLDAIAGELAAGWNAPDGFAKGWANPAADSRLYRSDRESLNDLFALFVNGLEQVRDTRIAAFLGAAPEADKPRSAALRRSESTLPLMRADITALKELFDASGLGELATGENAYLKSSIAFEFANADRALAKAGDGPVGEALADPDRRGALDYLRVVTSSLSELFGTRLSAALGLSAGFSSLDGD